MLLYTRILNSMDGTEELLDADACAIITAFEGETAVDIFLLIIHFYIENNRGVKQSLLEGRELPYGCSINKETGKGLKLKVSNIPEQLQRIISRYLKLVSV